MCALLVDRGRICALMYTWYTSIHKLMALGTRTTGIAAVPGVLLVLLRMPS